MKSNNAEDKDKRENKDNNRVDLETGRLIGVKSYKGGISMSFELGIGWRNVRSMVLLEPPAPAARVLLGRALAIFSFWSAAARRRMAVRGPPGIAGDEGRPMLAPLAAAPPLTGEEGRGEDYREATC